MNKHWCVKRVHWLPWDCVYFLWVLFGLFNKEAFIFIYPGVLPFSSFICIERSSVPGWHPSDPQYMWMQLQVVWSGFHLAYLSIHFFAHNKIIYVLLHYWHLYKVNPEGWGTKREKYIYYSPTETTYVNLYFSIPLELWFFYNFYKFKSILSVFWIAHWY